MKIRSRWTLPLALVSALLILAIVNKQRAYRSSLSNGEAFLGDCAALAAKRGADTTLCPGIKSTFFARGEENPPLAPAAIGAPPLPVDSTTKIIAVSNPRFLSHLAYCYFEFRGWFDPKSLSPEEFAAAATGFAILQGEVYGYADWLQSAAGASCRERVKAFTANEPDDLTGTMKDITALIALNPLAALKAGRSLEDIRNEAQLTLNHERIHVLQVLCPALDSLASRQWKELPPSGREEMKRRYPAYDWANPVVAARENLALRYETHPRDVLSLAPGCVYH